MPASPQIEKVDIVVRVYAYFAEGPGFEERSLPNVNTI